MIQLLLISLLIVYMLHPAVHYLSVKKRWPHGAAVGVVFVVFLLFCIAAVSLMVPVVSSEAKDVINNWPVYGVWIQDFFSKVTEALHLNLEGELSSFLANIPAQMGGIVEYITGFTFSLVSGVAHLFFVLFLVFYLLYDFETIKSYLLALVPAAYRSLAGDLAALVDDSVGKFMRGSFLCCIIVGVLTGLTLFFIGMPYPPALGFSGRTF